MIYAALCCIARDEDLFLKEWLAWHFAIGFERAIIYDNASARPISDLLRGFASPELVTVVRNETPQTQYVAYTRCLDDFGPECKWIAFLDVDEFLRPAENGDIRALLAEFEPYAALVCNWRMYSSSGHLSTPSGLVLENYTRYLDDNSHLKSVAQPALVSGCANPHVFVPRDGHFAVTENHQPVPPGFPFAPPSCTRVWVNHYYYKSRQCFAHKISKGNLYNLKREMAQFDDQIAWPDVEDGDFLKLFAPRLARVRAMLKNDRLDPPPAPDPARAEPAGMEQAELAGPGPGQGHSADCPESIEECADAPTPKEPSDKGGAGLLRAARLHLERDRLRAAELCLCHAMLAADFLTAAEVWTLRARIARLRGRPALAAHCLNQALRLSASRSAYLEMAEQFLAARQTDKARRVVAILDAFGAAERPPAPEDENPPEPI